MSLTRRLEVGPLPGASTRFAHVTPPRAPERRGQARRGEWRAAGALKAAASLAAVLLLLWHAVLSPRRYPPLEAGEKRLHLPPGLPPPPPAGFVEVVVSRFADDLSWLPPLALLLNATVTVYCKTSPHPPPLVPCSAQLANVGNEGHSYLHHMAARYDSLAPLTLFLPDSLWNDGTQSKQHFTHDVVLAIRRSRGALRFADMHVPDSRPRRAYSWLKELWQGFKLPCASAQRGGDCRWDGTTGGNSARGGALVAAEPPDFYDWMRAHAETRPRDMLACGWSFRGVFAASAAAVRRHPPPFWLRLEAELGKHAFPVAGMYMERLWRRVLLCS